MPLKVKCTVGLPIYDLPLFNGNIWLNIVGSFTGYTTSKSRVTLIVTFHGHRKSNLTVSLDSPYMINVFNSNIWLLKSVIYEIYQHRQCNVQW